MRFLSLMLSILLLCSAFAARTPFQPAVDKRFNKVEIEEEFKGSFSAISTLASGGTFSLGNLPVGAVITEAKLYILNPVISASDNTFSVGCESDADLFVATDLTNLASGSILFGTTSGPTIITVEAGCEVQAKAGDGDSGITSGDIIFLMDYFSP